MQVATSFDMTHEQLTQLASKEPPGCHGVTFLPYLLGERTPNWPQSTGALLGLRPGEVAHYAYMYFQHDSR